MGFYSALMTHDLTTFRKTVPAALRTAIGQREIKVSLRAEAMADRPQLHVELERMCIEAFENAKQGRNFVLPSVISAKSGKRRITAVPVSLSTAPTISKLYELWLAQTPDASPASKDEWKRIIRYFTEFFGDIPADQVNKAMVLEFRQSLRRLPKRVTEKYRRTKIKDILRLVDSGEIKVTDTLNDKSVNKYLTGLAAMFELARKLEIIPTNPASGLKLAVRHTIHDRKAFNEDELQTIFTTPTLTGNQQDNECYWPMWLGLYTGARLAELLQLKLSDIKQQNGIWYLDLNIDDGKRIKTASSIRKIPLHEDILRLGFIEYVQDMRSNGQTLLFPNSTRSEIRLYASAVSKKLNRLIDKAGIHSDLKSFYSLRHTFKDIAVLHDVPEDIRESLMGHSNNKTGRNYGSGQFLEKLNLCIQSLNFGLFGAKPDTRIKIKQRILSLSEIFAATPRLEIQEVAALLAPETRLAPTMLTKILCHQLTQIRCPDTSISISCSPTAFVTEPELKQALMDAKLLDV